MEQIFNIINSLAIFVVVLAIGFLKDKLDRAIELALGCHKYVCEDEPLQYTSESELELTRAYSTDAGMDIRSLEDYTLFPKERHCFKTGIKLLIPEGHVVDVRPRSGLAVKNGIDTLAGVVDEGYISDVGVVLINHSSEPVEFKRGDKIAQLVLRRVNQAMPKKIEKVFYDLQAELRERGTNGYGSSDNKEKK